MTTQALVVPGEKLSNDILPVPLDSSHPLKLGPGLRHVAPSTITPTVAGLLFIDQRKKAIWVENNNGRYVPQVNDVVVATVHHSSTDVFHCAITPQTTFAQLSHLAFEGVSKKTRPQLASGSLVYAKITSASKHMDPEITCCNPSTGKSDGMGELKEGMVFDLSLGMARRLLLAKQREEGGLVILEEIAEKIPFEIAVGRNGKVWVNSKGVKEILLVGNALQETDKQRLSIDGQKKLVRRLLKSI
ncbi:exosome non-catalytic core subunit rrp40 [Xylographa opegraphella]|nr:exosome non-catalytic core subunit rrp40 [Xylographa opegraphella]